MKKRKRDKEFRLINDSYYGSVDIACDEYDAVEVPARLKLNIALTDAWRTRTEALARLRTELGIAEREASN